VSTSVLSIENIDVRLVGRLIVTKLWRAAGNQPNGRRQSRLFL